MNIDSAYAISEAIRISSHAQIPIGPDTASALYTGARPLPCLDFVVPSGLKPGELRSLQSGLGLLTTDLLDQRAILGTSGVQAFFRASLRGSDAVYEWVERAVLEHVAAIEIDSATPPRLLMPTIGSVLADKLKLMVNRSYSHDYFDVTALASIASEDDFANAVKVWACAEPTKQYDNLERLLFALTHPLHPPEGGHPVIREWCSAFWPSVREDCDSLSEIVREMLSESGAFFLKETNAVSPDGYNRPSTIVGDSRV